MFWQPGHLGWEGERRERMAERRAAQLAAAAELAVEQPLLLSSGPDSPALERWIQRQLGQEGERLNRLRLRLWQGVTWQRTDRVLLVGMRSLLWAIDPLAQVPEGGVTLLTDSEEDRRRLEAQLDLLEAERRPQVICGGYKALNELLPQHSFEWIGGRLGALDLQQTDTSQLWSALVERCTASTRLRLLISRPEAGPATALLNTHQLLGDAQSTDQHAAKQPSANRSSANNRSLQALLEEEQRWLKELQTPEEQLKRLGWQLEEDDWSETLDLGGGAALEQRWLADGSAYRQAMQAVDQTVLETLRPMLRQQGRLGLALPMRHQLLAGRFSGTKKAPANRGSLKKGSRPDHHRG